MGFVEVKAPGRRPRPLQLARHRQLAALGCVVVTLDDPGCVEETLDMIAKAWELAGLMVDEKR